MLRVDLLVVGPAVEERVVVLFARETPLLQA